LRWHDVFDLLRSDGGACFLVAVPAGADVPTIPPHVGGPIATLEVAAGDEPLGLLELWVEDSRLHSLDYNTLGDRAGETPPEVGRPVRQGQTRLPRPTLCSRQRSPNSFRDAKHPSRCSIRERGADNEAHARASCGDDAPIVHDRSLLEICCDRIPNAVAGRLLIQGQIIYSIWLDPFELVCETPQQERKVFNLGSNRICKRERLDSPRLVRI
jgi:hypothetical protein